MGGGGDVPAKAAISLSIVTLLPFVALLFHSINSDGIGLDSEEFSFPKAAALAETLVSSWVDPVPM